jgi:hypothetical protein
VAINEDARLPALRASFLIVAGISLLSIFPAARLPKYVPGELSAEDIVSEGNNSRDSVTTDYLPVLDDPADGPLGVVTGAGRDAACGCRVPRTWPWYLTSGFRLPSRTR